MKRTIILMTVALLPFLTTACNTMSGAGKDLSQGGQHLEREADKHNN